MEIQNKILNIFEQIENLPQEIKDRILLYSNLTENDFERLKLKIPKLNETGLFS